MIVDTYFVDEDYTWLFSEGVNYEGWDELRVYIPF